MTTFLSSFGSFALPASARVVAAPLAEPTPVTPAAPALSVMTDLRKVRAITIGPTASIDTAREVMVCAGVRLVVVLDGSGSLVGLITARDLMGEKPIRVATEQRIAHSAVRVEHVMTPRAEIDSLHIREVERATVLDIVRELRACRRQHALVVEPHAGGDGFWARGIFSITQIGRQLGIAISADGPAQSFAQLEHLLADTGRAAG